MRDATRPPRPWLFAGALIATALASALAPEPLRAASRFQKKGPLVTLFSEAGGERTVEVFDLRFAHFQTLYRHTRAPRSENPTGERIEVVQKRKECKCVRLADYSRIKFQVIRQIEFTYPEGGRVALVRIVRRDGTIREYSGTALYGGDGLFPPRFSATVDGHPMEFPLVLPDTPEGAWPAERVVRIIVFRSPTPSAPAKKKPKSETP